MTGPAVRLHVEEAAVAAIAAAAARAVPGVVALRTGLSRGVFGAGAVLGRARQTEVSVTVADDAADLDVTIVTRLGDNCRDRAAAVQRAVTAVVAEQTGLTVRARVTVAEILAEITPDRPR